jgi:microcystin-dependent protein
MQGYMAEVRLFAGNFAPQGWAFCQGQTLSIAEYDALFSLIGTTYGGDGQVTFALPDLRSRVPLGIGQGGGSSTNYLLGQQGGTETNTLQVGNLPAHTHSLTASGNGPTQNTASGASLATNLPATSPPMPNIYVNGAPSQAAMAQNTGNAGGNSPLNNIQPYGASNYIIALEGIYPSRN